MSDFLKKHKVPEQFKPMSVIAGILQISTQALGKHIRSGKIPPDCIYEYKTSKKRTFRYLHEVNAIEAYRRNVQHSGNSDNGLGGTPPPQAPAQVKRLTLGSPEDDEDQDLNYYRKQKLMIEVDMKKVDLAEKMGKLVPKKLVTEQLFEFGQVLKTQLVQMPRQAIDGVLAAPNRLEALKILEDFVRQSIKDALEKLENIEIKT